MGGAGAGGDRAIQALLETSRRREAEARAALDGIRRLAEIALARLDHRA